MPRNNFHFASARARTYGCFIAISALPACIISHGNGLIAPPYFVYIPVSLGTLSGLGSLMGRPGVSETAIRAIARAFMAGRSPKEDRGSHQTRKSNHDNKRDAA